MLRAKVVDREVFDEGDVLLAQCPNPEAAQYIAAALDLMAYVRERLKHYDDVSIRLYRGVVEVGTLARYPEAMDVAGRAKTLDAAVSAALEAHAREVNG